MNLINFAKNSARKLSEMKLWKKIIALILILVIGYFVYANYFISTKTATTYQTATVEKGTLITSITASGTVSSANNVAITSNATGVIHTVYVKNGDTVTQGQKIAEITLDQNSTQKQAAAWASYLSSVNQQQSAQRTKLAADASMWTAQQQVISAQNSVDKKNAGDDNPETKADYNQLEKENIDSALIQARKNFSAVEKNYLEADAAINASNASVSSAWLAYQQVSPTITAPTAGIVSNLSITEGTVISSASTDTSQTSTQKVGTVTLSSGKLQSSVSLSEVDVTKVKSGQKASMTLDAFPNKKYTGIVSSVDTNGQVSSGVTTYPAIITFDLNDENIYPNMAVSATIITSTKSNALIVPASAIQTVDGISTVKVLENGNQVSKTVAVGSSNDTEVEIISGLNEGETVMTGTSSSQAIQATQQGTSPFGNTFGGRGGTTFGGGGNVVRIQR